MEELKPCPFCSGKSEIRQSLIMNPNSGYPDSHYINVVCIICGAMCGKLWIKTFNEFSSHTVEDFRESNLLRANEGIKYDAYMNEQKTEVAKKWNIRFWFETHK